MKTYFKPIFSVFISLLLMLISIAFSATAVLYFRPLYYGMINKFVGKNNLSFNQIKENYDVLIDYNSFWGPDKLKFPYLPSSENALTHFEEVKAIFLEFQIILIIGLIATVILIFLYKKLYRSCSRSKFLSKNLIIFVKNPFSYFSILLNKYPIPHYSDMGYFCHPLFFYY